MQRIADEPAVPQVNLLQHQPDPPLLRLGGEDGDAALQRVVEVKGLRHLRRPAALQLADLENVVDQGQQVLR